MSENERLKHIMTLLGFKNQTDFAIALGMTQGGLSNVFRSKAGIGVSDSIKLKLNKEYYINISWLETGYGEPFEKITKEQEAILTAIQKTTNYSPEWIATGMGRVVSESLSDYSAFNKADVTDRFLIALELLKEKNISYTDVANKLEVSTSLISEIRRGKSKISHTTAQKFAEAFDINPAWLLQGKGEDIFNVQKFESNAHEVTDRIEWIDVVFVPIHARATFAETFFDTNVKEIETVRVQKRPGINYDMSRVFEIDGDSMDPTLVSGEQVLCEIVDFNNWKFTTGPVVVAFGNMVVIKRIKDNEIANGKLVLWSDNELGGKMTLSTDTDEIRRIYKVKYTVYKPIR